MTDVKKLSAMEVVVGHKPVGMSDPGPIYQNLQNWLAENDYVCIDTPIEINLSGAGVKDYAQTKTEILIPVRKIKKPGM